MSSTGTYGGYGPQNGLTADYPPGPTGWQAGASWPLRSSGQVYAQDLNAQVSVPVGFLARKPYVLLQQQSASSQSPTVSGTTPVPIVMDTEIADAWGMHSNSGDLSQLVIPANCDGYYLVTGQVPLVAVTSPTNEWIQSALLVSNLAYGYGTATAQPSTASYSTSLVADLVQLPAGRHVQLAGLESSGSGANTVASTTLTLTGDMLAVGPRLSARWVGGLVAPPSLPLSVTTPVTWTDNVSEITSAQFNTDIRQSTLLLSYPPLFRVYQSTAASVTGSAWNILTTTFSNTIDTWSGWGGTAWTCPLAGLYALGGTVSYAAQASPFFTVAGVTVISSGVTTHYQSARAYGVKPASAVLRLVRLNAGDTVQLATYQTSGSTISTSAGTANTYLFGAWLSA